jgi:hypothetical protein
MADALAQSLLFGAAGGILIFAVFMLIVLFFDRIIKSFHHLPKPRQTSKQTVISVN